VAVRGCARAVARIWASARAPQLWTRGAPPLPGRLALGLSITMAGVASWIEREGCPHA
jgi:hypothetical protein